MLTLVQVTTDTQRDHVRELLTEYLRTVGALLMQGEWSLELTIQAVEAWVEQSVAHLGDYAPPDGCLLIAYDDGEPAGCVAMRRIGSNVAEMKRMWVRPAYRRKGIGRAMALGVIAEARRGGYRLLRLDSPPFFQPSHSLYRSVGFLERPPYPECEVPEYLRPKWGVFMELALAG